MPKRKWDENEKKLVVLELLRNNKSVSEIAKERGISDAMIYKWRDQALKAIQDTFKENGRAKDVDFRGQRDQLLKIIGEQACVTQTLKKISEIS
jgi:transposase-like protein